MFNLNLFVMKKFLFSVRINDVTFFRSSLPGLTDKFDSEPVINWSVDESSACPLFDTDVLFLAKFCVFKEIEFSVIPIGDEK